MSDLISRSSTLQFVQKIKDKINDNKCFGDGTRKLNMGDLQDIILFIKNAPTAYDTEKAVEELEEQKVRYKNIRNNTHCIITETSECDSCRADHYLDARLNCVDRAIEIVRKGGVE